jgi:hypothetical protein
LLSPIACSHSVDPGGKSPHCGECNQRQDRSHDKTSPILTPASRPETHERLRADNRPIRGNRITCTPGTMSRVPDVYIAVVRRAVPQRSTSATKDKVAKIDEKHGRKRCRQQEDTEFSCH